MYSLIRDDKPPSPRRHEEVAPSVAALQAAMRLPQDEEKLPFALQSPPKPPVRLVGRREVTR